MTEPIDRLRVLRQEFDQVFADPHAAPAPALERLIAIRVGGQPYALRLSELNGLLAAPLLVPLAGAPAECLGVAGLRGRVVPVFALGPWLGHPAEPPRWLALTGGDEPVAYAFAELEGFREAPAEAFMPAAPGPAGYPVTTLWRDHPVRGVIDLSRIRETLKENLS